jgi:two-component system, NtrC family, response regulator HydG
MTRVLIVDDDNDHAESLSDMIEMRGHSAAVANSGEAAIGQFGSGDFDFVLLDVRLPGVNGVDTFLALKRIRPGAQIMIMTGFSVEQLVSQAIEAGALGVLHKPFAVTEVLDLLNKVKQRGRVLVADGDADFVESIVPILESARYSVEVASTGAEALDKLSREHADCLLLNLRLPVVSGAELYAQLVERGPFMPTVLIAGGPQEAEQDERLRSEASGMLFNPFDPNALLAAIDSAVSRGQTG